MSFLEPLAAALTACCTLPYLRDIARGTTRPHRISWFLFALLSVTAAMSQHAEGAIAGTWLAAGAAVGFTAVFVASIFRGAGGASSLDVICLVVGLTGVATSLLVGRPLVATIGVIVAELAAASATAKKAYGDPGSETLSTWVLDAVAGGVAMMAVARLDPVALMYPTHHLIVNLWIVIAILAGRQRLRRSPPLIRGQFGQSTS
jgi:hypothetical protein